MTISGNFKPFGIGSLPFKDSKLAWESIFEYFPEIPFWPQLPNRSFLENMYIQFSEHLPGRVIDLDKEKLFINTTSDLQPEIEGFYNDYLTNDLERYKVSRDYCEGIYAGLDLVSENNEPFVSIEFMKGQITGPVSFGLQVADEQLKPILYNEMLRDVMVKNLQRKAEWQEAILGKFNENVIVSVDEPYLSSIGSGLLNLNRDNIVNDIESVFKNLKAYKAMHCCGNTDWSLITETSIDILLFDAYNYMNNFILFSSDIQEFLDRGGCLGWGIVPSTPDALESVDQNSLINHLEAGINSLSKKGIDKEKIIHQSFITPSCGLGTITPDQARTAMALTRNISGYMRKKYDFD